MGQGPTAKAPLAPPAHVNSVFLCRHLTRLCVVLFLVDVLGGFILILLEDRPLFGPNLAVVSFESPLFSPDFPLLGLELKRFLLGKLFALHPLVNPFLLVLLSLFDRSSLSEERLGQREGDQGTCHDDSRKSLHLKAPFCWRAWPVG